MTPSGFANGWEQTDLWRTAAAFRTSPSCETTMARRRSGSARSTSGQTFLYDARGTLLFSGGITGARAHAGDNAGRQSLVALLNREPAATSRHQRLRLLAVSTGR